MDLAKLGVFLSGIFEGGYKVVGTFSIISFVDKGDNEVPGCPVLNVTIAEANLLDTTNKQHTDIAKMELFEKEIISSSKHCCVGTKR
jgi:hypothetical protein